MARQQKRIKDKALLGKDRVGFILDTTYALVILLSALIFFKIIYIQLTYKVDPRVESLFRDQTDRTPETRSDPRLGRKDPRHLDPGLPDLYGLRRPV